MYIVTDPGYSICWDNVQMENKVKSQCSRKQNYMHLWANAYAALHRVNNRHLDDSRRTPATLLPITAYIPTASDLQMIR